MTPSDQPRILLISGPPFGPRMWDEVMSRLPGAEARSVLGEGASGWAERGAALASAWGGAVVVAHGLAVPAIVHGASLSPPRRVILSNGPLVELHPAVRAAIVASRLPGVMRPAVWVRALASSAALRRVVANPYVMDRDTVDALCAEGVSTPDGCRAMSAYLASLSELPPLPTAPLDAWLVGGAADPLHPAWQVDRADVSLGGGRRVDLPGGRWLHPVEAPWAFADVVARLAAGAVKAPG